jgi:hypothetical protein
MNQANVYDQLFELARHLCEQGYYVTDRYHRTFVDEVRTFRPFTDEDECFEICSYACRFRLTWGWPFYKWVSQLQVIAHASIEDNKVVICAYDKDNYNDLQGLQIEGVEIECEPVQELVGFEFNMKKRRRK